MPFVLRPFHRVPVQRAVTYNTGPFQGQGTGWRLSGDLPMRPGDTLLFTVTLPNEQRIEAPNPHNSRRLLLQPPIRRCDKPDGGRAPARSVNILLGTGALLPGACPRSEAGQAPPQTAEPVPRAPRARLGPPPSPSPILWGREGWGADEPS